MRRISAMGGMGSFLVCLLVFVMVSADAGGGETPRPQSSENSEYPGRPGADQAPPGGPPDRKEAYMAGPDKLSEEEGKRLIQEARDAIEDSLFKREEKNKKGDATGSTDSPKFQEHRGTFVTLSIQGQLRGCIGHIIPQGPLIEEVRENALNAAFRDPRFPPLSSKEWENVEVELSILTEPRPLDYRDAEDLLSKLRPGIDGVIIKKGYHQATFLPQVWEQLPEKEAFLGNLCLKAGLENDAWKAGNLEVSTYQVQAFEE